MARGEAYVRCPHCGFQSRVPVMAMQRDNYHCSQCGCRIPLANLNLPGENQGQPPFRSRTKSQFQKRRRR